MPTSPQQAQFGAKLHRGALGQHGYALKDSSDRRRHMALNRAVKSKGRPLQVFRKLVALSTLHKRTNPMLSRRALADAAYVKQKHMTQLKKQNGCGCGGK